MAHDNHENGGDRPPHPQSAPRRNGGGRGFERDRLAPRDPQSPAAEDATTEEVSAEGERISKFVSRAGIASRRDVERMIEEGRLTLNGEVVTTPVTLVTPGDRITVDGVPLPGRERTRLFLYHKPAGLVTTEKDPEGRRTVFEELPSELPRLVSIGRLDLNTEGLLLLTNDGGLARVLAHPTTGWLRRYRVRAFGEITQDQLDGLRDGIEIDGIHYGPVEAHVDREQGANMWLTLGLREGKNREVKRILEHFGLQVNRLIRVSFGPFQLGELPVGEVEEIRTRVLRDQLGEELAREANANFVDEPQETRLTTRPERRERPGRGGFERPARHEGGPRQGGKQFGPKHAGGPQMASPEEARALRKEQAIAQGQRRAAHRHSWRDPESWAARGKKKPASEPRQPRGTPAEGGAPPSDARAHLRGGRIADRKGRSVLVERIAQDPAAAERVPAKTRGRQERGERATPPRDTDVLRRKTRREQDAAAPSAAETGRRRPERSEASPERRWSERGAERHGAGPDRRRDAARPPRREGGERSGDRPWQRRETGERPRGEGFRPRSERSEGFKPRGEGFRPQRERGEGFKPRGERPGGFKPRGEGGEGFRPRGERPAGFKPRAERGEGFKPRGERSEGFKPRGERPGGFKPRGGGGEGFRPRGERPAGFKPRGERSEGFKPRGERSEGFKPRGERTGGFKPRGEGGEGFRPRGERPAGFKPRGERSEGFKPRGDRPSGLKPRGEGGEGFKPRGERTGGFKPRGEGFKERSGGFKPRGERSESSGSRGFGPRPGGPRPGRSGPPRGDRPSRPAGGRPPRRPAR
jgi:23S rRNA pseudouridine2605 synthase